MKVRFLVRRVWHESYHVEIDCDDVANGKLAVFDIEKRADAPEIGRSLDLHEVAFEDTEVLE
jgi:hypothetical protein